MFDFKNLDKRKIINLVVCSVSLLFILVSTIVMISSSRYMRLTIGADFVIRWLLIFVVGLSFSYGIIRLGLCSITNHNPTKASGHAFLFFGLGELCAMAIAGLTLFGDADYQQNMNLIEDVVSILIHLVIGVLAIFGWTLRYSKKKMFVVSLIAFIVALLLALADICLIGPATVRAQSVDYVFVLSALGSVFPYLAATIFARTVAVDEERDEEEEETEEVEVKE